MAMTMTGHVMLPADRATVWAALNDPEILKSSIPGCQELAKTSDTEFTATAKIAVGPVKATFKGKVSLSDIDAPNGYTISGEGQGGVAGFAKGGAKVRLDDGENEAPASATTWRRMSAASWRSSEDDSSAALPRNM